MERNVEDILAELRAKRAAAEKAPEADVPAEQPAAEAEPVKAEEPAAVPAASAEPVREEVKEEAPAPAEEPSPAPEKEPEPAKEEKKPVPEAVGKKKKISSDDHEVDRAVGDIYTASFTEKAYKADRQDRRRAAKNRKALVDKESGKTGFIGGLFRLIGFIIIVALTILLVLIGLQFIADVEIIPVKAIIEQIIIWFEALMAKLGL